MKTPEPKFRHEFKYLISASRLPALKVRQHTAYSKYYLCRKFALHKQEDNHDIF